jgi:hypothetical protein
MELRGPRRVRQAIAEPDHVRLHFAWRRLFCPENPQEVPYGEIPRVTEACGPENADPRHTRH